ncbi:MAG: 30S ribosomal protein S2 [Candidatus Burarchaeum sp.]|nr:30S ribosomal protein S2 [Candidatus Burarchaeum sp.]MDO8339395.1 30S ribosomal protein S2 [Candidatus Burarchaeum sp.]
MADMLLPQEKYLESGIHIGTKMKTPDMKKYIYKERQDKLYVLDLKQVDERIRLAARFIARYEPQGVYIAASRTYAGLAASKFVQITGCNMIKGRFIPGSMTNPSRDNFCEPTLLVVCDPKNEWQAIREATTIGAPVISLCDTDNVIKFIDLVVPCNNKGKKALALIFFLLAREVLKARGTIANDGEFGHTLEEFDVPLELQAGPAVAPSAVASKPAAPAQSAAAPAVAVAAPNEGEEKNKHKAKRAVKKKDEEPGAAEKGAEEKGAEEPKK